MGSICVVVNEAPDAAVFRRCAVLTRFDDVEVVHLQGADLAQVQAKLSSSDRMFFAWGSVPWRTLHEVAEAIRPLFDDVREVPLCWGVTRDGHPRAPIILPTNAPVAKWCGYRGRREWRFLWGS